MGVILGIDIGGSSTKIVGLHENGTVIDMLRVKAEDPLTSLYGALGNFLATHSLKLTDIGHIALTGVGASYVDGDIYGVRTVKVEEFPSVGVGGLALSRKERAVVVSMGTGTSLLWAEKGGEIRHIIGSGIGGGTLSGLSELITGVHQYALIRKLCQDGDLSQIDLTIGDMSKGKVGTLPPEFTDDYFTNFGVNYGHILQIDRHLPWTDPNCVKILDAVQPKYLTHELSSGPNRPQLAAVKRQLGTIRKGYNR